MSIHIYAQTQESQEMGLNIFNCILKIIGCKFLICVLPFTPLKYENF